MSWQSPPLGVVQVDYRGARFLLGRTSDAYAIWDTTTGGAPLERFALSAEGWAGAWTRYRELEGPAADAQAVVWTPSPTATWQRGRRLALAPMRVGQILDGAFKLYRMHFRTLAPAVALVVLPFHGLILALTLATLHPVTVDTGFQRVVYQEPALWVNLLSAGLQTLVITPFLTAAVVRIAADAFLGRDTGVGAAYRAALPRIHSILWVSLIIGLGIVLAAGPFVFFGVLAGMEGVGGVGVLLFLIASVPAIFLLLRWLFASSVVMVEDVRGISAVGRSWRLMRGLTWKALGTLTLMGLLIFALYFVVGIIIGIAAYPILAGGDTPGGGFYALSQALGAVTSILTTPFTTLVIVLLYFDARMRKEGFDLEVMADELSGRA